ncbi:hypothetical protein ACE6H2_024853 [Prunus campanulata]
MVLVGSHWKFWLLSVAESVKVVKFKILKFSSHMEESIWVKSQVLWVFGGDYLSLLLFKSSQDLRGIALVSTIPRSYTVSENHVEPR